MFCVGRGRRGREIEGREGERGRVIEFKLFHSKGKAVDECLAQKKIMSFSVSVVLSIDESTKDQVTY